jgi:type IV secretory pathway TraG/TraD family ATPase VirD4
MDSFLGCLFFIVFLFVMSLVSTAYLKFGGHLNSFGDWGTVAGITLGLFILVPFIFPWLLSFLGGLVSSLIGLLPAAKAVKPKGFYLALGKSTGALAAKSHATAMRQGQEVFLALPDACQNIVTIGGIGSGKTTRIMQPVLNQLLVQDCGGLIFDIKGDFGRAVYALAGAHGRQVKTIGVGQQGINVLEGLTPEMASSFLKSAFYLAGGGGDKFWIDTASELCKNALGVLSYIPGEYTLDALYRYLFFEEDRQVFTEQVKLAMVELDDRNQRLLKSYLQYYSSIFSSFDDKVQKGVLASVAQVLSPFQHPDLIDAFCSQPAEGFNLETVLAGDIYLVDLPLATWGLGAKAVYTFLKLRFFNVLQQRTTRPEWNQDRPVFFMCDEYQEIISANKAGLSDLSFWDKSRSAKCIGIISAQSVNSFRSAIGDRTLADTVLQNFRQKVIFRTEDVDTLQYLNQIGGRVEVKRESKSEHSGSSSHGFLNSSSSQSKGTSVSWTERATVDAPLIRSLGPNQAVALLNINGHARDDVVNLQPLFVD